MINLKQELANYTPIDIKALEEAGKVIPDNVRNSIILYNKALESIRQNSEDIAIIELKKAISMNPDFHEAMNLLGLCYSYTKEDVKAAEIFNRVVTAENNSVQALRYLNSMNGGYELPVETGLPKRKNAEEKKKEKDRTMAKAPKNGLDPSFWDVFKGSGKTDILKYVIGFTAGAVVILLLTLPFGSDGGSPSPGTGNPNTPASGNNDVVDAAKYSKLESDFQELQKQLEDSRVQLDYYRNAARISEAERLVDQSQFLDAAELLVLLRAANFKDAEKTRYDALWNAAMPRAVRQASQQGVSLFNSGKYAEAVSILKKIETYGIEYPSGNVGIYYLGKSYGELNDIQNAAAAYQKVIATFPGTQYATWSQQRLNQLTPAQ